MESGSTWLNREFSWSTSTAERKMRVAELGAKFVSLTNLKLAATTLYRLADHENEDDLPAIIEELAKHATKTSLKPREAERVIKVGIGRRRFGDRPDATLVQLVELDQYSGETWYEKAVTALQERNPETDEGANSIINEIEREHWDAEQLKAEETERRDEVKDETEDILDGASARSAAADKTTRTAEDRGRHNLGRTRPVRPCCDRAAGDAREADCEVCRHVLVCRALRGQRVSDGCGGGQ